MAHNWHTDRTLTHATGRPLAPRIGALRHAYVGRGQALAEAQSSPSPALLIA